MNYYSDTTLLTRALVLPNDFRLELPFAIAGYFDLNLPKIALQFLSALSIPRVAAAAAFGLVLFLAQVVGQLGLQRSFNQRLR